MVFILLTLILEPYIVHSLASRRTDWAFAAATQINTHILFATVKTVTKTTAVNKVFFFYTPWRHKEEWSYCSTHSQYLHQMAVNGQFHALATVPWGKAALCRQIGWLDGLQWRSGCFVQESNVLWLPESNPRPFCT